MLLFLTSSPGGSCYDGEKWDVCEFDNTNGFVDALAECWPEGSRCLFIASDPEDEELNDYNRGVLAGSCECSGLYVSEMDVCDRRNPEMSAEMLNQYDVVILSGGHVPTESAFFQEIGLRDAIQAYEGLVIGISAGTMNCAEVVYAMPELETEDPDYERFIPGLGLMNIMVIPHFQVVCEKTLDGKDEVEEIACPDSMGNEFVCLVDGSYLVIDEEETWLFGEAYLIKDGEVYQICEEGQEVQLGG